jgi:hypothetical protein
MERKKVPRQMHIEAPVAVAAEAAADRASAWVRQHLLPCDAWRQEEGHDFEFGLVHQLHQITPGRSPQVCWPLAEYLVVVVVVVQNHSQLIWSHRTWCTTF